MCLLAVIPVAYRINVLREAGPLQQLCNCSDILEPISSAGPNVASRRQIPKMSNPFAASPPYLQWPKGDQGLIHAISAVRDTYATR